MSSQSNSRIYRYVLAYDGGTAPRPFGGICSLAICKPRIRVAAAPGDWIIGFRSRHPGEVVYAMQVSEAMPLGEYWKNPRFVDRRPGALPCPDNFYRPDSAGRLQQVPNDVHVPDDAARDLRGRNVLLATRFWYFGRNAVLLPNHLMHLVHTTQGHVVHKNRRADDCEQVANWLAAWPPGMHGKPIDREIDLDHSSMGMSPMASRGSCSSGAKTARTQRATGRKPSEAPPAIRSRSCSSVQRHIGSRVKLRKLVLSRKGFDSGYGGMPSPILPDGRLLPLPIPAKHDAFSLGDLNAPGLDLAALMADLSRSRLSLDTPVHLDPDLDREPRLRLPGWRPALGQTGNAQSHLEAQGVGPGDVFLFFGWFRQAEQAAGHWRFVREAPDLHVLFGWLEIGEILPIVRERPQSLSKHPWIANHPHMSNPGHYTDPRNTLYIAPIRSAYAPGRPGGGVFRRFSDALRLTAEAASRSTWMLPEWFHPMTGREPLTYHSNPERWSLVDGKCRLKSVAKGQEFVLDVPSYPEADNWVSELIAKH